MNQLIEQIKHSNDTFRRSQCRHTLPEGRRCGSPALRGERFCYYHHAERKPVADARLRPARRNSFSLAQPRSRAAIQESLGEIIARIAQNDIDPRRAGLLLYALQIATTNLKDHQNSQASESTTPQAPPAKQKCHPERSGGAAESKDLRFQNSDDSFDTEIFPKPQPRLRPVTRATAATLLEALARHKGIDPQPGSPNDRKPTPEPTPETLSTLHAAHASEEPTSHRPRHRNPRRTSNPLLNSVRCSDRGPANPQSSNVSNLSPTCHFIAQSPSS